MFLKLSESNKAQFGTKLVRHLARKKPREGVPYRQLAARLAAPGQPRQQLRARDTSAATSARWNPQYTPNFGYTRELFLRHHQNKCLQMMYKIIILK